MAAAGTPREETLCYLTIEEMDPSIRYCAYHLKLKGGQTLEVSEILEMKRTVGKDVEVLAPKLKNLLAQARKVQTQQDTLEWRLFTLQVPSSDLSTALESIQSSTLELQDVLKLPHFELSNNDQVQGVLSAYDALLGSYWEAHRLAEHEMKAYTLEIEQLKSSKSEEKLDKLSSFYGYITYQRLMATIQRNHFLIEWTSYKVEHPAVYKDKSKKEDVVKLYDLVGQVRGFTVFYCVLRGTQTHKNRAWGKSSRFLSFKKILLLPVSLKLEYYWRKPLDVSIFHKFTLNWTDLMALLGW